MSIQGAIVILEHEVEALEQRRAELLRAIETLRPFADERPAAIRNPQSAHGPNGAEPVTTTAAFQSGAEILQALRAGPMKPRDLAKAIRLTPLTLRVRLKPMIKARSIVVTGKTVARLVSLPPAAKEGL